MAKYEADQLDRTFAALSHEVRRKMLRRLRQTEMRVTELAEPFSLSLPTVSKHIRMLEGARLVRRRIEGREHWISADPEPLAHASSWIESQAAFWGLRLEALAKLVER